MDPSSFDRIDPGTCHPTTETASTGLSA